MQQTSTPCFSILSLICLQWEDLHLAEPFTAVYQHCLYLNCGLCVSDQQGLSSNFFLSNRFSFFVNLSHTSSTQLSSTLLTLSNPCDTPVSHLLHPCDCDSILQTSPFSRGFLPKIKVILFHFCYLHCVPGLRGA